MIPAALKHQILELPESERLEVVEAIWQSLEDPDSLPLPEWQKDVLDERLATSENEVGRDWEEVEAALWPRRSFNTLEANGSGSGGQRRADRLLEPVARAGAGH